MLNVAKAVAELVRFAVHPQHMPEPQHVTLVETPCGLMRAVCHGGA